MAEDKVPFERICEIAREVSEGYNPRELPSIEQVSWAFRVEGKPRLYYTTRGFVNRVLNTQEGNALWNLMPYRNLDNLLKFLCEGKCVGRRANIVPNHTGPIGNADDAGYMVYGYLNHRKALQGELPMNKGLFWEAMPENLVSAVLKIEQNAYGAFADESGNKLQQIGNSPYVSEALTREYLQNVRQSSELGREHFQRLLTQKDKAKDYDQLLVDTRPELWTPGTEFQHAFYRKNEPKLLIGKVISNKGNEIELLERDEQENYSGDSWTLPVERFRKFGEHGMVWRVVSARKIN